MAKKQLNKTETPLKGHKKKGKVLEPPFIAGGLNMSFSSWVDERLPEMLWAVLIVGNMERNEYLKYFRYIGRFIEANSECYNITLSGIASLPEAKRKIIIRYFTDYSQNVRDILRSLLLIPGLPCFNDWENALQEPTPEDWKKVSKGIDVSYWHQTQEATDCRWIKVLCMIVGGKLQFTTRMKETLHCILEYPNYGDMQKARPSIRAMEIGILAGEKSVTSDWSGYFWKYCYDHTKCVPEEVLNDKIRQRQEKFASEMKNWRNLYIKETAIIRNKLIDHFFATTETSAINPRLEGAFGLSLYANSLFIEIIFYSTSLSITGRLGLRALIETYITFLYLLQNENNEPKIWDDYRSYGTGQIKHIYLKMRELRQSACSIEMDEMYLIANEDLWAEFVSINLGHWDSANLRDMAEATGTKVLYDKYFRYTSGFMHGNWGAIRESVYQKCVNPLHRYHRIPTYDLPLMPSVTKDAVDITNKVLECLSVAYPDFDFRFTKMKQKKPRNKGSI